MSRTLIPLKLPARIGMKLKVNPAYIELVALNTGPDLLASLADSRRVINK